jgi:SAM-dependent methyltransferase
MYYKGFIKKLIPGFILRALHKVGFVKSYIPLPGKVSLGDLNRTTPLSKVFGSDRGGPLDRYYIMNFLGKNADAIHGRVLEIGDNGYTLLFGGAKVQKSDILHFDTRNKKATFVGDLTNAPQLQDCSFDCIILTQTLQFIYRHVDALQTCYRILKPGGKLLLTVPGISNIEHTEWMEYWQWSYTKSSISNLFKEAFSSEEIVVEAHGNVLIASAFLFGMGVSELTREQLDEDDPYYQVLITAAATKQ